MGGEPKTDDWESTTKALAETLKKNSLMMVESGSNWKVLQKLVLCLCFSRQVVCVV